MRLAGGRWTEDSDAHRLVPPGPQEVPSRGATIDCVDPCLFCDTADRAVMSGDPPPDFGEFVAGSLPALMRLGHMLTGSLEAGEDLVQSALVSTLAAWPRLRPGDPFGYVRRVMINENISSWRRWGSRVRYVDPPERPSTDDTARADVRMTMRAALAGLAPRQRTTLVLRYYYGLNEQEIAREMGCSPGTVKSQAARGLASLRQQLVDAADTDPPTTVQSTRSLS